MADTGNPNFFKTFKGKYSITPINQIVDNEYVMLSCVNDVQPLGDWTLIDYVSGSVFGTLPIEVTPGKEVRIPVVVDNVIDILHIQTNGDMSLDSNHAAGVLYLSGVNFNISDKWY